MALVGVELETLVSESDALTIRPPFIIGNTQQRNLSRKKELPPLIYNCFFVKQ